MKKLLTIAFTTSALAAFAVTGGNEVGVLAINSTAADTIVAVPFSSLSSGSVKVSELVKTTNLKSGDSLWVFENGAYSAWVLDADGGSWVAADVAAPAGATMSAGGSAASKALSLGSAIWLRRGAERGNTFYIYGAYEASPSSTITAGTSSAPVWNLIANPKSTAVEFNFTGAAEGDTVRITSTKFPKVYTYKSGKWTYKGAAAKPTIPAGQGLWYVSVGGSGSYAW